jgi:hypothetical protein
LAEAAELLVVVGAEVFLARAAVEEAQVWAAVDLAAEAVDSAAADAVAVDLAAVVVGAAAEGAGDSQNVDGGKNCEIKNDDFDKNFSDRMRDCRDGPFQSRDECGFRSQARFDGRIAIEPERIQYTKRGRR